MVTTTHHIGVYLSRMNETETPTPVETTWRSMAEPNRYEIRIKGYLDTRWADWFEGLTITRESNGVTLLTGPVADQAALHGLLRKIRDLGMVLIAVNPTAPDQPQTPDH
jgi:hypothetical protein